MAQVAHPAVAQIHGVESWRASNETTNTDAAILADFRCRLEAEFRGVGIERVRGVVPGGEPGASRVLVVRNADAAAALLHSRLPKPMR